MTRMDKVNELIAIEVAKILKEELDLAHDVLVTVVRVMTSRTLEHATVYISVLPESEAAAILTTIGKQIYDIQQILNDRVILRKIPKLSFKLDTTEEHAAHIEKLLGTIVE